MINRSRVLLGMALTATMSALGCSAERIASPEALVTDGPSHAVLSTQLDVVRRKKSIGSSEASATIGMLGGSISLPGAGLRIVVPAGAVLSPTKITVTAVAGDLVTYEFKPHGQKFLVPLVATQDLSQTLAPPAPVYYAAHFNSLNDIDTLTGVISSDEVLRANVSVGLSSVTFSIPHFSGWVAATGRE